MLSSAASQPWTAAVAAGTSGGLTAARVVVDVGQGVDQQGGVAGVGLAWLAALAAARVDVHDALVEVAERTGPPSSCGQAAIAASTTSPGRRTMRVSAVHARATVGEDVERLVVLDEDPGLLQHLERLGVDRVEIGGRDTSSLSPSPPPAGSRPPLMPIT